MSDESKQYKRIQPGYDSHPLEVLERSVLVWNGNRTEKAPKGCAKRVSCISCNEARDYRRSLTSEALVLFHPINVWLVVDESQPLEHLPLVQPEEPILLARPTPAPFFKQLVVIL